MKLLYLYKINFLFELKLNKKLLSNIEIFKTIYIIDNNILKINIFLKNKINNNIIFFHYPENKTFS